jgi:hypothetical protein
MAYQPHERLIRMRELMKEIDTHIMMCDDVQDLIALASAMMVSSKSIFKLHIGTEGTRNILNKVLEELDDDYKR